MFIVCVIVSVVTAVALLASALMKVRRHPICVESVVETCGVPLKYLPVLAALEVAAAAGIVIGLWWAPLGIAAAIGAILYFVGAILAHLRVRDVKGLASPVLPLLLAVATLVLRLATV